jgi:hypothetical protein
MVCVLSHLPCFGSIMPSFLEPFIILVRICSGYRITLFITWTLLVLFKGRINMIRVGRELR